MIGFLMVLEVVDGRLRRFPESHVRVILSFLLRDLVNLIMIISYQRSTGIDVFLHVY
jgi:hypothetical protein